MKSLLDGLVVVHLGVCYVLYIPLLIDAPQTIGIQAD